MATNIHENSFILNLYNILSLMTHTCIGIHQQRLIPNDNIPNDSKY